MKNLVWLAILLGALYFGHRWWQENVDTGPVAREAGGTVSAGGGPVREWQHAPDSLSEMNDAMDSGRSSANSARNTVRDKLNPKR